MDVVDQLIAKYKAAKLNEKGESDEKIDVIIELEDLKSEKVIPFFLNVLLNEEEYDLARIEILKILKLRDSQDPQEHSPAPAKCPRPGRSRAQGSVRITASFLPEASP